MIKQQLLLIFLFLGISFLSLGQDMSVKSFYLAETDLTANTPGTMVYDQNGNVCALIKVETTLDGFSFDVGSLGVSEVKRVGGEMWVYVPFGIRKITLSHPQLGIVRDYALPVQIEKGRTYILKLNAALGNRTYDSSKKQRMILQVSPADADVEINGMPVSLDGNGIYEQEVSFGIYDVIVTSSKYHSVRRQIEINDPTKAQRFNVHLRQAYGWLRISGTGDERMSIDGRSVTFIPNERIELMSGYYKVILEKPLHQPFERTIEIKDSVVCEIEPKFVENYRELEFIVDDGSEIWLDDVKVGTGRWKGKLEYGAHRIECRKVSHRTTERTLNVDPMTLGPIVLESPEPIYGALMVTSNPSGAKLYVNNEYLGVTPKYFSNILTGDYSIFTEYDHEKSLVEIVKIEEGQGVSLDFDMNQGNTSVNGLLIGSKSPEHQLVQLVVDPIDAIVEIDGEIKNTRSGVYEELLPLGRYRYKVYHGDYHESSGFMDVSDPATVCSTTVKLTPAFGYVTVTDEELYGAQVFIDDTYFGAVPFTDKHLSSGIHSVVVSKDRYHSYTGSISINDEEKITLAPELVPVTGSLSVSVKPANAKLSVDNRRVAPGKEIDLIIGEHTINVTLDGYYSQRQRVVIKENQTTNISISLRKEPISPAEYDRRYRNIGFVNSFDFKYSLPLKSSQIVYKNMGIRNYKSLHPIEFTYSLGYRYSNWVSISVGTGITHETVDLRDIGDEFADYYYDNNVNEIVNYSTNAVPIFANSKLYLSRGKYQPMMSISAGLYVVPKIKGLLLCDFGFGVNYRITRVLNCYAMLSVGTTPVLIGSVDVYSNKISLNRSISWAPCFKIGLTL